MCTGRLKMTIQRLKKYRDISDVHKEIKMATERLTGITEILKWPQKD
jgi:hypothetical protein